MRLTLVWRYVGGLNAGAQLHLTIGFGLGWTNKAEQKIIFSSANKNQSTVWADVFQIPPQTPSPQPLAAQREIIDIKR